ncbi:Serine/threonine-protein phosphatase 2A activator [Cryptotermes secundus]|uniref:Serine/threonine-protein phosphatase 2A activator n=2 Tax=Cryptotermes secundus TaxID=105785 RepID=A0A2J7RF16_9NEOP|nr:serine/threonine-protein phosphatase 2A activator isoform X1 [Cryptotermes secundus]PNF39426.1 Serine/threonine-protein phosphatase 2A activator [Cryptotermes secundus]
MDSVVSEDHEYLVPKRAITSVEDMQIWEKSEAYFEYLGFIMALNEAVKGKSLSVECPESDVTKGMVSLLDKLDVWIEETPPIEQPQRFGNQAFRTWYKRVKEGAMQLLQEALPGRFHRAVPEIMLYLSEGFGNSTRIDYGTGHEMSFIMLMCCLFKIGSLLEEDKVAAVTRIFNRYLLLVRKLQLTYRMEPAGSHGVWSLDDYQFVPFIWGSSQLVAHPRIEPRSFLQADVVQSYAKDYMFISCIQFINKVKTGLFAEHSNQLWNISAVPSWTKINGGLIKMYKAEVLAKFPVIQHVLFGSLLPFKIVQRPQNIHNVRLSVTHQPPASFPVPSTTKTTNDTAAK